VIAISDPRMEGHDPGPGHPESPARLRAVREALARLGGIAHRDAREIAPALLSRVHTPAYLAAIALVEGASAQLDADTVVSAGSGLAARLAAGAAIQAVDAVFDGEDTRVFAAVRPPGHHALPDRSMGFCVYGNAALAAERARERGAGRVWVVDWDVHHGNGTQAVFASRADVLFCSVHQEAPFWPGTGRAHEIGRGEGRGYTVNCPLPPSSGDADHLAVFERLFAPIAESFRPDFVVISAGFDAHRADPLGGQRVTEEGFAALAGAVVAMADRYAGGRVVALLEGGYDLDALGRSTAAVCQVLAGSPAPRIAGAARPSVDAAIARAAAARADLEAGPPRLG
jgi:acetoin utilization deacetylase AcuC-like enzyme